MLSNHKHQPLVQSNQNKNRLRPIEEREQHVGF